MGYDTEFKGKFKVNPPLDEKTRNFLCSFSETRRMARFFPTPDNYGVEGEFYIADDNLGVMNMNKPPSTQPGLWCDWAPSSDGKHIGWNGAEKFYFYVEWIVYLIERVLEPKGYSLNGQVEYQGEDIDDFGIIHIINNEVTLHKGIDHNTEYYNTRVIRRSSVKNLK